jgi:hypothetical protein
MYGAESAEPPKWLLLAAASMVRLKKALQLLSEVVMEQYRIAVVVGSLRKDSFNRKLASAIVRLAPSEF